MAERTITTELSEAIRDFVAKAKAYSPQDIVTDLMFIAATYALTANAESTDKIDCHDFAVVAHTVFHRAQANFAALKAEEETLRVH